MNPAPRKPDESTYSGRFAARLRTLREKAGLSVEETVAKMATHGHEMAARSFYHWEQAKRDPPLDAMPAIAKALGLKTVRVLMPEK